jgi:PAS domain S-box-containing protein
MYDTVRVLLVDGDADFAGAAATDLEEHDHGFSVTVAPTASEATERIRAERFDCVVSGYDLPERDGIALLETVRDAYPDLPFVLYTDAGSEEVAAAAISADVTEYLQRAADTDGHAALAEEIRTAVGSSWATGQGASQRERLEQILKTVPGCVVEVDGDGRFVYANRRAEEVLGLNQSEVTSRAYNDPEWEIRDLQGDPIPDEELPFRRVLDSGAPVDDYEHSIRWPDGTEKVLSVSGAPLFDDEGHVESVVFSLDDVTEQKRRERKLERQQRIVEQLDDVATIIAPDGTITYVSPAVERLLGYEPEDLIGENGFGYQPPETREAVQEAIESVLSDPAEPRTVQTKFRRADGSWCWVESTLKNYVDDDAIDGILVSSRDVTERQDRKRRLRKRERQVTRLHEATRELLASESTEEVAATASRTAVDVLDLPLNGIHFYDETVEGLRPVAVSDGSRELLGEVPVLDEGIAWKAFQAGEMRRYDGISDADEVYNPDTPIESELHVPLAEHGVFVISSTETGAFEETDVELARILAANTEAALERIDSEQRLRTREGELQQQNERLEEFASIVSHDLRNPLNVAQVRTELLGEERDSEHLNSLEQALDRMEELVSDTLTLARQGDIVAETEPISLADLVGQCWRSVASEGAAIEVEEGVTIRGDRSRLQHVFENLFRNALEHGGEDVTVRVGRAGDDGIYVEDDGSGIPEGKRENVFDPGHTSAEDGTGFGLTIVRRIAEAHGWEVESVAGTDGGARFEFSGVEVVEG